MVLLKNDRHVLPLAAGLKSILIVGSHADVGVLSGGGSSQVYSVGGVMLLDSHADGGRVVYFRPSPMESLAARTRARLQYDEGADIKSAATLAGRSDAVVVFAHQWNAEGVDGTLRLSDNQDALIAALAKANPRTIVVLETGGPVLMPWISHVAAVLEAWYPGSNGGDAIARILTGEVNPSGRLPVTFPRSLEQLPRPRLDGFPEQPHARFSVDYTVEGAAVGYKWFDRTGATPLFPFGFGLSYGRFGLSGFDADVRGNQVSVRFSVRNTGDRQGSYVAQVYASPRPEIAAGWEAPRRLCGYKKVNLQPGESADVTLSVDPRLLAQYDSTQKTWITAKGEYELVLSSDARTPVAKTVVRLAPSTVGQVRSVHRMLQP